MAPHERRSTAVILERLADLAPLLKWTSLSIGILWGCSAALERLAAGSSGSLRHLGLALMATVVAASIGFAGWVAAALWQLSIAMLTERLERASRADERFDALAHRTLSAIERLATVQERRQIPEDRPATPERGHSGLLAEIDDAIRSGRRGELESLIDDLARQFPDAPELPGFRQRLDAARLRDLEDSLAQIHAARQVNDPGRVLELYRGLESRLELDRRSEVERELSRWFLEMIHRRLRGGRIQVDLVELATQVAETFASTREGASLRASLPTLRRSVGLCPRCARPYAGLSAACPECLTGTLGAPSESERDGGQEAEAEADGPAGDLEPTSGDGRNTGWMFYDEDDRDNQAPPT